ncbi:MAG: rod shape-determining protein, partial [Oscillospiraceae bacterium]|nr:rod shape-determining protein [Oscillospiraceae bacterium]
MDIGLDLGTANIIMTMGEKGIVLNEPSVVAFNKKIGRVIAVGEEAYKMIGKTPGHIETIRPLAGGVISDEDMTQCMIREFIYKVCGKQVFKPQIIICVPSFITEVESRAVIEAAHSAGARKVYLIQEPIAALIGTGVDIARANGNLIVDIGGGTTDVAVISLNGIVLSRSIKTGGNKLDESVIRYMTNKYRVLIGERTAESAKCRLGNVFTPAADKTTVLKGRCLTSGMPIQFEVMQTDIFEAIVDDVTEIVAAIKNIVEDTPPELVSDIYENGIILTGGGALL